MIAPICTKTCVLLIVHAFHVWAECNLGAVPILDCSLINVNYLSYIEHFDFDFDWISFVGTEGRPIFALFV